MAGEEFGRRYETPSGGGGVWYTVTRDAGKVVTVMRATNVMNAMRRAMRRLAVAGKRRSMFRRAANHNVHVMTAHGRTFAGRKGRKG